MCFEQEAKHCFAQTGSGNVISLMLLHQTGTRWQLMMTQYNSTMQPIRQDMWAKFWPGPDQPWGLGPLWAPKFLEKICGLLKIFCLLKFLESGALVDNLNVWPGINGRSTYVCNLLHFLEINHCYMQIYVWEVHKYMYKRGSRELLSSLRARGTMIRPWSW